MIVFHLSTWLSFFLILLMVLLAIYSWNRRYVPGALPFAVALLFAALWATGSVMEYLVSDVAGKIFWVKFQAAWYLPTATAVTSFLLEYTWPGRWLSRRNLVLLSVLPLLIIGFILTDDINHLMWQRFVFNGQSQIVPLTGLVGWIGIIYGYGLLIVNFFVFTWLFVNSPQHRWFVVIMLVGQIATRSVFLLDKTLLLQTEFPIDVFELAFVYTMYTIALFRFHVLNPTQYAYQTVITQMREGILVLDLQGRITSLNATAERILGVVTRQVKGRPVSELLPAWPVEQHSSNEAETELKLGSGEAARDYILTISLLKDWRELDLGWLLLLHDVTEQKKVQAQIIEQQRALATLKEREQISRELHDELAQELALIKVQAELVDGLLETDQVDEARLQLQYLSKVAREIQLDVRGQIRELSVGINPEDGFLGALCRFLNMFQQMYEIETELVLPDAQPSLSITPTVEAQLLRIIQESFNNIRKHAQAKHVRVALSKGPECLELNIDDDGVGFDPDSLPNSGRSFGLGIMASRAKEINGWLAVKSVPGQGTRVMVEVPTNLKS